MKKLIVPLMVFALTLTFSIYFSSPIEARAMPESDGVVSRAENASTGNRSAAEIAEPAVETAGAAQESADDETVITLGDPITVVGSGVVVSGTTATITAGGTYRATGTLADGMLGVNTTEEVVLILDGASITHSSGPAVSVTNAVKLSLVLADGSSNTLVDGASYSDTSLKATLFSNDTLEISGNGALTVTGNYKHGVASDDDLIISGGSLTIVSAVKDGFHANDNITVSGGTIHVTQASSDGLESEGDLVVEGGALTLAVTSNGIKSASTLTVTAGTIDVTSGVEGVESKSNLIVSGGAITAMVSDDGLKATNDITINGGQVYLNTTGDAMESSGTLNINGGVIVALGGDSPESGLDCGDTYEIVFNGGTVVATGGTNGTPSSSSAQHVVVLGSRAVGTVIHIEQDDGTDVLTFEVSKAYQSMIFTSPDLVGDKTYTISSGGNVSGGTDFHGLYTGATYSGGSTWATFTTDAVVTYATEIVVLYLPLVMKESSNTTSSDTVITLGDPITVTGSGVAVSGSTATITAAGTYYATGTLSNGMIVVDTAGDVELILDGVTINHTSGPAINVVSAGKLSLVLVAGTTNTLFDGASYTDTSLKAALFSNDTLEISGSGTLAITGRYKHGIASDDDLIIKGGTINIVSAVTDGFHANDNITVSGGTIRTIQVGSDGFESEGDMVVSGGTFTLAVTDDGMISADTLTINGGTIDVTSGVEGIESKNQIIINDGAITIAVSDDGLNAANDVTINGGQIYLNATADAVDSNGTLNINGGVIVALGGNVPEGGLDCDNCAIALNGGIVVSTGGRNSTPSSSSAQHVVVMGSRTVGTVIHIVRNDGTDVLTFKVSKAYQSMIFTSPALLGSRTYTAYTGGSVSGGTDFHGLYTGATYSGGSTWATFTTNAVVTYAGGGMPAMPDL